MAKTILTAKAVEAAKPRRDAKGKPVRTEFPDAASLGLRLIVQPSGSRSWALRYRRPDSGKTAKRTFPGTLSLAAARLEAAKARLELQQGIDPAPVLAPALSGGGVSIELALAQFIELHVSRKVRASTSRQYVGIINRIVLPAWRGRRLDSIRRRDVISLVEHVAVDRSVMANRVLAVLSKFFRWARARDLIETSPVTGVERPHSEEARQRKLTDDQLRRLWIACDGDSFGPAVRLLILTAARENEVGQMVWPEIDGAEWKLPAVRAKNNRAHTITLPKQAQAILESMPRFADCEFVFTTNGRTPISSWGRAKIRLSAKAGIPAKDWRIHDLRRSVASKMQALGASVATIERALNHTSGTFRGIVGVYQTDELQDDVQRALQRWADHVEHLAGGQPAKVIKLRR